MKGEREWRAGVDPMGSTRSITLDSLIYQEIMTPASLFKGQMPIVLGVLRIRSKKVGMDEK